MEKRHSQKQIILDLPYHEKYIHQKGVYKSKDSRSSYYVIETMHPNHIKNAITCIIEGSHPCYKKNGRKEQELLDAYKEKTGRNYNYWEIKDFNSENFELVNDPSYEFLYLKDRSSDMILFELSKKGIKIREGIPVLEIF